MPDGPLIGPLIPEGGPLIIDGYPYLCPYFPPLGIHIVGWPLMPPPIPPNWLPYEGSI